MLLRGRRMQHWLFAAFSTCVAFWYVSQSLADLMKGLGFERVTAVLTVLLPQFAVHLFDSITPLETSGSSDKAPVRSKLPKIATGLALPMLAVALSPYHNAGPVVRALVLGAVYFYVFGLLASAMVSLWLRGQHSPSRAVRDRIRFLASVGALAMTFTLADFLSFLGVYLPPIGAVLAIVFLFVLAESLTRPRLADLYELSGRLLVSTALAFALAGIFYFFITYVGRFGAMYLNAVLAAIVFLVLFEPLEHEVETRINRFFFRERYDLETSVVELRRRLAHALENEEMVQVVLAGLEKSRRVTSCAVYLRDLEDSGFDVVGSVGAQPPARLEALAMRPLLERLGLSLSLEEIAREADTAVDAGTRDGLAPVMTAVEALGPFRSSVILAIRGDSEELVGLLFVADERVRDAFTPEEIALLETVSAQMGVAIANSRIYSRMKERDRLAALGSMAAGLAHEVKNPLGAIKGAAQLLEELGVGVKDESDPSTKEFLGIILEETDRLNRVVGSFLDYARPHAGNPVPVDVNAAVRRTVQILSSQQTEGIDLRLELAESVPRARIDPEKLRQVLLNLVQNAIQAMNGTGRVTVSTHVRRSGRGRWVDGPPSERSAPLRASNTDEGTETVEIAVHDTGPGISQKVLKNLFVPFFTTKETGTGLGLAISQSIVQNAGGSIQVQSQAGLGSKFIVSLPAADESLSTPLPTPSISGLPPPPADRRQAGGAGGE
ncbi:MAG: GAF domain-containing protein [Deltaproteobacteria bacterium]|nr:GAF domain-containing protein [Deltaproteobacteria bacterium]